MDFQSIVVKLDITIPPMPLYAISLDDEEDAEDVPDLLSQVKKQESRSLLIKLMK